MFFDDGSITVEECGVKIKAIPDNDKTYPGICIYVNGELVSRTEFNSETRKIRTIAYGNINEEPVSITDYNRGEID